MTTLNTPFRWLEADDHAEPHRACKPFTICDAHDNDVCEIYSADDATVTTPREQAIAIARLFAAAPQMLATLRELQIRFSPFGAPGALIDETIRLATGRAAKPAHVGASDLRETFGDDREFFARISEN